MNAIPEETQTNTYGGSENEGSTTIGSGGGAIDWAYWQLVVPLISL